MYKHSKPCIDIHACTDPPEGWPLWLLIYFRLAVDMDYMNHVILNESGQAAQAEKRKRK